MSSYIKKLGHIPKINEFHFNFDDSHDFTVISHYPSSAVPKNISREVERIKREDVKYKKHFTTNINTFHSPKCLHCGYYKEEHPIYHNNDLSHHDYLILCINYEPCKQETVIVDTPIVAKVTSPPRTSSLESFTFEKEQPVPPQSSSSSKKFFNLKLTNLDIQNLMAIVNKKFFDKYKSSGVTANNKKSAYRYLNLFFLKGSFLFAYFLPTFLISFHFYNSTKSITYT